MVGQMNLLSDEEINFFNTWSPKKEDYEIEIVPLPDETLAQKITRLFDIIGKQICKKSIYIFKYQLFYHLVNE